MTITATASTGKGIVNRAVGRHINDSAEAAFTKTVGFLPRYVIVVNLTDRITGEWYEGMAADSMIKTVAAGTRSLVTSDAITVTVTGFTLAADSSVNGNNKQLSWVAEN